MVFNDNMIKILIIYIKTETSIWLLIKKNKYINKGLERPDKALSQVDFKLNLYDFQFHLFQAIY